MELVWSDTEEAVAAELASLARSRMFRRPIALAGFMGVGKSTLGRLLAELLERPFFDTDSHVAAHSGRSIVDFFVSGQEAEFRRLEAEAVAELLAGPPAVVALGGGALLDDGSRRLLRRESLLVHLHVPWNELREHVPGLVATRPLLQGKSLAEIHRIYLSRLATYRSASLRITVGHRSATQAASEVLAALRSLEAGPESESTGRMASTERVLQAIRTPRKVGEVALDGTRP